MYVECDYKGGHLKIDSDVSEEIVTIINEKVGYIIDKLKKENPVFNYKSITLDEMWKIPTTNIYKERMIPKDEFDNINIQNESTNLKKGGNKNTRKRKKKTTRKKTRKK